MSSEKDFQRWLRVKWREAGGWSSSVEFAPGGDEGHPDMVFWVGKKFAMVELKVATVKSNLLMPENIRPSQIIWHRDLLEAGGESFFLFGVQQRDGSWAVYGSESRNVVAAAKAGLWIDEGTQLLWPARNSGKSMFSHLSVFFNKVWS